MSTNFPTSKDNSTTLPVETASSPLSTNHVTNHTNNRDAIIAIQTKVGIDGDTANTSHDYKLSEIISTDKTVGKTATQTLTNKTLTAPVVTSPKITVGSDAVGDLYYKSNIDGTQTRLGIGSASQVLTVSSGLPSWQTPAAITDASLTAKGVVELATSAEINAGTATGGTGAALAVTPDALAASVPTFDGSNLIGTRTKINITTADTTVANTTTETDLFSVTIPAGTLSTNNGIKFMAYVSFGSASSGTNALQLRVKYGSTTYGDTGSITISNSSSFNGIIYGYLYASGSTSSQDGFLHVHAGGNTGLAYNGNNTTLYIANGNGTATEDSTEALSLKLTAQWNVANASNTITIYNVSVEKIV